mmetsp:Transcript_36914/g.102499  ORF Transcript_36914/g.102499 Transcript_36914/m.102499 type:complete len:416 (-) Transcript_36914:76-1323(-)
MASLVRTVALAVALAAAPEASAHQLRTARPKGHPSIDLPEPETVGEELPVPEAEEPDGDEVWKSQEVDEEPMDGLEKEDNDYVESQQKEEAEKESPVKEAVQWAPSDVENMEFPVPEVEEDQPVPAASIEVAEASGEARVNATEPAATDAKREKLQWTYFPPSPRLGLVTGGLSEEYADNNFAEKTSLIMHKYAEKKGYALYVDRNISRHSSRNVGWNKIVLMQKLLDDVPLLVWMDSDIVLTRLDVPLDTLLTSSACNGARQQKWAPYLSNDVKESTFLWMGADMRYRGFDQYTVNTAPGLMVLRRGKQAKEFLEKVWEVGYDPLYYLHHWAGAKREEMVDEWPYEQGAVWDILTNEPNVYMRNACIAPLNYLQSVTCLDWNGRTLARHCSELPDSGKNKVVDLHMNRLNISGI